MQCLHKAFFFEMSTIFATMAARPAPSAAPTISSGRLVAAYASASTSESAVASASTSPSTSPSPSATPATPHLCATPSPSIRSSSSKNGSIRRTRQPPPPPPGARGRGVGRGPGCVASAVLLAPSHQEETFSRGGSSSTSTSSTSSTSSNNNNDSGSSSSPEIDDSDDDDANMSSGSTASSGGSDCASSSHDSPQAQPQPNKYRRTVVHSQRERVLDVDAMSSDGCPVHMLCEGEYSIHRSNEGQVFFSFLRLALLRSGVWGGQHCHLSMQQILLGKC